MPESAEPPPELTHEQGRALLRLARRTIAEKLGRPPGPCGEEPPALTDPALERRAGVFVTLELGKRLRGCIGTLHPNEPIVAGVRSNALNAAFHDPRFKPLAGRELDRVRIEVSVLSPPRPLSYTGPAELLAQLTPHVHGVIIRRGHAGATFLPQVWGQLPKAEDFLNHLCQKAGLAPEEWRRGGLEVSTYRVQCFKEE
ncbi:MAG: AmmeMemoRadiSam system protein A [Desulfobacterales bacterium]|jgi:AmmeMemoRadiSam system protein A|nr:AmmeMemoRadiSam system protein A [Desulfobacterales bacterium]